MGAIVSSETLNNRANILEFEKEFLKLDGVVLGDSDIAPLKHSFVDGVYIREMFLPAGATIVGKIQKLSHVIFLMKGTIKVFSEDGGFQALEAPNYFICPAGTKRIGVAITDVVWVNVHPNPSNTKNLEKIEKKVIVESYEAFDKLSRKSLLSRIMNQLNILF